MQPIISFARVDALDYPYPSKHYDIIFALNVFLPGYCKNGYKKYIT